ncbi:hypothetical protein VTN77DRAFT_1663 [Rasamsonia byssochlamydoides]|uniref:uncharacterized protein n=1 Tax=Rasamsonia byssochlamydoides TaxID=89139 RepID=UPI0037445168
MDNNYIPGHDPHHTLLATAPTTTQSRQNGRHGVAFVRETHSPGGHWAYHLLSFFSVHHETENTNLECWRLGRGMITNRQGRTGFPNSSSLCRFLSHCHDIDLGGHVKSCFLVLFSFSCCDGLSMIVNLKLWSCVHNFEMGSGSLPESHATSRSLPAGMLVLLLGESTRQFKSLHFPDLAELRW